MTQVQVLISDPAKGQLKSFEITDNFLPITGEELDGLNGNRIRTWSQCVCLVNTHRLMCNMTYSDHYLTFTLGQFSTLTFQDHHVYVSICRREKYDAV